MSTAIHIHKTTATAKECMFVDCPDCKKVHPNAKRQSLHLLFFTPWYGWSRTCIQCGRKWEDGEWMPLAFDRNARKKNIRAAKMQWRMMPPVSENHYGT